MNPYTVRKTLSWTEQRLWQVQNMNEGGYNHCVISIQGALNIQRLSHSLQQIVDRHEILRTVYVQADNKQPVAHIYNTLPCRLEIIDDPSVNPEEIKAIAPQAYHNTNGTLEQLSSLCARLVCLPGSSYYLVLMLPSITVDSTSMKNIIAEIYSLYQGILPERRVVQFSEFVDWQYELMLSADEDANAFWETIKLPPSNEWTLSFTKNLSAGNAIRKTTCLVIDETQTTIVRKLVKSLGTEMPVFLLACFKSLLFKYTGHEDIRVGFVNNQRSYEEFYATVGVLAKTLPHVTLIRANDSFKDLLAAIKTVTNEITGWEDYYNREGDPEKFQAGFDYTDARTENAIIGETSFSLSRFSCIPDYFPFMLQCYDYGNILHFHFTYDEELFNEDEVDLFRLYFQNIFRRVQTEPGSRIGNLDLIARSELLSVMNLFNTTKVEWKNENSIISLFEAQVVKSPDAIALVYNEKRLSYKELNEKANQFAHYLRNQNNIGPGDVVGIVMRRTERLIIALLGILKSGAAYLPVDIFYPAERKKFMLQDAQARVVVTDSEFMFDLDEELQNRLFVMDIQFDDLPAYKINPVSINTTSHIAYVLYTSGSTGTPKGVMVSHFSLINYSSWFKSEFAIGEKDSTLLFSSVAFDLSYTALWPSLISGSCIHLLPETNYLDPAELSKKLRQYPITFLKMTPSHFGMMVYDPHFGKDVLAYGLRLIVLGGEEINTADVEYYLRYCPHTEFVNHYGPTETTIGTIAHRITPDQVAKFKKRPVIGRPISNNKVYILENNGYNPQPIGVAGEICIAGHGLAAGYLNNEQLTQEKFIVHPFDESERLYRTGDLGRWQPSGAVEFLGRKDDQVKIRGYRVEPGEIKKVLQQHNEITDAVCIVHERENEKILVAYYAGNRQLTAVDLRTFLMARLPEYMVPEYFIPVAAIPLTPNGKVNRKALPAPESVDELTSQVYMAPVTEVEKKLVAIWEKVLGRKQIGINDNFFEIGGHSLRGVQILSRIHKELSARIELRNIFESPTIAQLAGIISGAENDKYEFIEPAPKQDFYELSHAQKRLWVIAQIEEDHTAYNRLAGYTFEGRLDRSAFEKAFQTMVRRHENLRTTFVTVAGIPMQKIHDETFACPFEYYDLSVMPDKAEIVKKMAEEESGRIYDLEKGPLLNCKLIALGEQTYVFLFNIHHIISDGWSMKVMANELLLLYNSFSEGKEDPLLPLRIQYKDFAQWQNRLIHSEAVNAHKTWWLQQFTGNLPVLQLTTDFPRPANKTYNGSVEGMLIGKKQIDDLHKIGQQVGASLFMTLIAALKALLYRYTGQEDLVIGTPIAGRDHGDLENQIGFYVNTLALRNRFNGLEDFISLLQKVKETTLAAYDHQLYPYDSLIDDLNLKVDRSRTPLFDVNLVLYNTDIVDDENVVVPDGMGDVTVSPYQRKVTISRYDLLFHCTESESGLFVNVEYNTDLFLRERIMRMLVHFNNLITFVVKNSRIPLSQIDYLDKEEKHKLLNVFNATDKPQYLGTTLHQLFAKQVLHTPELPAIIEDGGELTYAALDDKAERLAGLLLGTGFSRGSIAAIMLDNTADTIAAMLGVLKAGGAFLPVDPSYPYDRLKYIITDANAVTLISEKKYIRTMNKLQWECEMLKNYVCVNSDNVYEEPEEMNELMKEELWDYVGKNAADLIAGGGWVSSYTGEKMSEMEMDEYADNVLQKLTPFLTPSSRVLEIGCSSGISMFRIAPLVKEYYGTDLSAGILEITEREKKIRGYDNIVLKHLAAHEISQLHGSLFDVVIINSVVQSFNGYNYLRKVMESLMNVVTAEAIIFFGDIQDLDLKDELIDSLKEYKAKHADKNYRTKTDWSNELFVPKAFFDDMAADYPSIASIFHSAKLGNIRNELTDFRYDTIIRVDKNVSNNSKRIKRKQQFNYTHWMASTAASVKPEVTSEDLAYIIYTSGSTGYPKGVAVTHNSIGNYISWASDSYFRDGVSGNMALITSIAFDLTLTSVFCPLLNGKKLFIVQGNDMGERLLNAFANPEVDTLKLTPSHIVLLNNLPFIYTEIEQVIVGGEELKQKHVEILRSFNRAIRIYNEYGPTENTVGCTMGEVSNGYLGIGKPIANTSIYILDQHNELLPLNHVGEICTAGDCLARGYLNRPDLTDEKFIDHPFEVNKKLYKTGDLGRWLENGQLEMNGRKDDQVKIRGYRIELGEIEKAILTYTGAVNCAVIAKEGEDGTDQLIAYLVTAQELNVSDIRNRLAVHLPGYMIPSYFLRLNELPMTANGKADRKALPDPAALEMAGLQNYTPPSSMIEKKLVDIWEDILKRSPIGIRDNFFDHGGHSLKATQVVTRIYQELHAVVTLGAIFTSPTIEELAQIIASLKTHMYEEIPLVEKGELYDASHAQKRLWIPDQMEDSYGANMAGGKMLTGTLNEDALERAFNTLLERHEILRTTFVLAGEGLKQKVHAFEAFPFKLEYIDLRNDPLKTERANVLAETEAQTGFDLANGPLLRVKLVHLEEEAYLLLITIHHIISDGWSMDILIKELTTLYEAYRKGWKNPLPGLRLQYKDYTAWQNSRLKTAEVRSLREYWLGIFKGPIPLLNLPADYPRPAIKTYSGEAISVVIANELAEQLSALGRKHGASLFMVCIASLKALFYHYTHQQDIVLGMLIAGREHKELENQIGLYANALALRTRFSAEESFESLLDSVKQTAIGAYENALYPFDMLIEDLKISIDRSRSPIFDVLVVQETGKHQVAHSETVEGVAVGGYTTSFVTSKFDMGFYFVELGDMVQVKVKYNKDIFKKERIILMAQEFIALLLSVAGDPSQAVTAISLSSGLETAPTHEKPDPLGFTFSFNG